MAHSHRWTAGFSTQAGRAKEKCLSLPLKSPWNRASLIPRRQPNRALPSLSKPTKSHVAVAFVPALINPPGLNAVVQNLLVNTPAFEVGHHRPIIRGGLGQKQVLGLFLLRRWHKGRRRDGSPSGDSFHGLQKGIAVDLDEIVQRAGPADSAGKPAPLAIGNPQAVMGFGAVDVAGDVDQLLGFAVRR